MVFVNLCGGLGNQLIQLALAYRLDNARKCRVCVCSIDKGIWEVSEKVRAIARGLGIRYVDGLVSCSSRRHRRLLLSFFPSRLFIQNHENLATLVLANCQKSHVILDGYWQDPQNIFELSEMDLSGINGHWKGIEVFESIFCVLHVRLGDYNNLINRLIFNKMDVGYYTRAIKLILNETEKPRFLVCSNGSPDEVTAFISSVADELSLNIQQFSIVSSDETDSFSLMLNASYIIGANSTFSLMSYVLSRNTKKLAIFPARWFRFRRHPLSVVSRFSKNLIIQV